VQREQITIQDAHEPNLPGVLAIFNEIIAQSTAVFIDQPLSLDELRSWYRAKRDKGLPVLIATDAVGIAGFAALAPFRDRPCYRHSQELSVHVRADARGRGIGSQLLVAIEVAARAASTHVLVASIDAANAGSIRLHERAGFTQVGHMPQVGRKFGRWLDLVLMQKVLRVSVEE
jgi:phosphinothricin acetyltransferase